MGLGRLRRGVLIAAAASVLAAVPCVASGATVQASNFAGSSLRLSGPTSNKMGSAFKYTISGTALSPADYVVAWEQFYPQEGCATTYAAESTRTFLPDTYGLTLFENRSVSHNYSIVEEFGADHLGKHGICAYLIDLTTGDTYAYAGQFWTNHK
ncbi:MAG: hypothetical protein ABSA65_01550 [Acidimicrobiales bacterium]